MPYSYSLFKAEFLSHITSKFPKTTKILDVGAGAGSYGSLLKYHFDRIDGIEIYDKYVDMFGLKDIYSNLYLGNILTFDFRMYDYIILGDVIEHIPIPQAKKLVSDITKMGIKCMVAVPYLFEQGEEYGNIYEIHTQPDLTQELMLERYPELKFLFGDVNYGYYINYDADAHSNKQ